MNPSLPTQHMVERDVFSQLEINLKLDVGHAWTGRKQHYLFLGSLSFERSPILLYLAVDVFFCDPNINSQFREELFFFGGGGGWRSCWSTNMFLIFICSPLQKPCLFSGRSQPVMFGFSRGVYKCEFLNPVKPWKNHTNLKITCLHFGFPAKPVKLVDGLCETKTQGFGHRCWLQRKWHI